MYKLTETQAFTRSEAFGCLKELLENSGSIDPKERRELEQTLLYFAPKAPKAPKTPKTGLDWIRQALPKKRDTIRPFLNFVTVLDGKAFASDSQCLRYCEVDLPDGFFEPKSMLAVEEGGALSLQVTRRIYLNSKYQETNNRKLCFENKISQNVACDGGMILQLIDAGEGVVFQSRYLQDCGDCITLEGLTAPTFWRGHCAFGTFIVGEYLP